MGPIRVPEILSNDEIQVFKNLRPPVPEYLTLFNVFKKVLVTNVQNFLIFDKIILKIFRNYKISLKW
jgi:hypothetical protein